MAARKTKRAKERGPEEHEHEEAKLPAEQEGGGEPTRSRPIFRPRVDIAETDEGLVLVADLPGADPEHINVSLERRQLTISAEVEDDAPENMSAVYREYEVGDYEREFRLTGDIDTKNIAADFRNGVLTLKIPKAPQPEAKRIEVKS